MFSPFSWWWHWIREMEVSRPINRWQIREGRGKALSRRPSQAWHPLHLETLWLPNCSGWFTTYGLTWVCLPWKTADEHFPEREGEKEVGLGSWWNEPTKIFANYPPNGLPDGGLQIWLPSSNGDSASRWCFCSGLAGFLDHPVWNRKGKINNYTLLSLLKWPLACEVFSGRRLPE